MNNTQKRGCTFEVHLILLLFCLSVSTRLLAKQPNLDGWGAISETHIPNSMKAAVLLSPRNASLADAERWQPNDSSYQCRMSVYARVLLVDASLTDYSSYELAAFVGGECRGKGIINQLEDGYTYVYLPVYGEEGDEVTYRLYDSTGKSTLIAKEITVMEDNATTGTPSQPLALHFYPIGDVDTDGKVSLRDLSVLVEQLKNSTTTPNALDRLSGTADVDGDGFVNLKDISRLAEILLQE